MRILYVAPVGESGASNGGYSFIGNTFDLFFNNLMKNGVVTDYDFINPFLKKEGQVALIEKYDIGLVLVHPDSFKNANFKTNIEMLKRHCNKFYLHVFWETSKISKSWNHLFTETLFDGFVASSDFVVSLIQDKLNEFKSKQTVNKIYPVFYKDNYKNCKINIENKSKEKLFTVLYMGQYTKRKGFEDAITVFTNTFKDEIDCRLILKYHRLSQVEFPEEEFVKRTVGMNSTLFLPHIYEVTENLNRDQIFELYRQSSVCLHLSRGEGFGLVLTETGISGLPLIYADNSSCSEVVGKNRCYSVSCYQDSAIGMAQYNYDCDSEYGIPSMKETIVQLRRCYDLWKEDKEKYYDFDDERQNYVFDKFSEKVVFEQIIKLI